MVSSVFEKIGDSIDEQEGLKTLTIRGFEEQHSLEMWPLSRLVTKAAHCEQLTLWTLEETTEENRRCLLDFVG